MRLVERLVKCSSSCLSIYFQCSRQLLSYNKSTSCFTIDFPSVLWCLPPMQRRCCCLQ